MNKTKRNENDVEDPRESSPSRQPATPYERDRRAYFTLSQPGAKVFWIKAFLVVFALVVSTVMVIRIYVDYEVKQLPQASVLYTVRWAIGIVLIYGTLVLTMLFVGLYVALKHYWRPVIIYGALILIGLTLLSCVMCFIGVLIY